jgi:hypothetical protein
MQFEPRKGGTHGLGLDPGNLRQSGLGDGTLGSQDLHGDNAGMRQANRLQFLVP